jgi:hypothetical protein
MRTLVVTLLCTSMLGVSPTIVEAAPSCLVDRGTVQPVVQTVVIDGRADAELVSLTVAGLPPGCDGESLEVDVHRGVAHAQGPLRLFSREATCEVGADPPRVSRGAIELVVCDAERPVGVEEIAAFDVRWIGSGRAAVPPAVAGRTSDQVGDDPPSAEQQGDPAVAAVPSQASDESGPPGLARTGVHLGVLLAGALAAHASGLVLQRSVRSRE